MEAAVNPSQLVLPWCPVAAHGVNVTIDQARSQSCTLRIHDGCRSRDVQVFFLSHALNHSVDRGQSVGIENRLVEVAAEEKADIANDQLA